MPKRTDAYLENRREQLIQAAYKCFLENGYHAPSISDICREANVSVGTIYKYFSNKREIFLAAQKERFLHYFERPPIKSWSKFKKHYIQLALSLDQVEVRAHYRVAFEMNIDALFDEEFTRAAEADVASAHTQLVRELDTLAENGAIALPLGSEITARIINALLFNLVSQRCWRPSLPIGQIAEEFERTLDTLVGARIKSPTPTPDKKGRQLKRGKST